MPRTKPTAATRKSRPPTRPKLPTPKRPVEVATVERRAPIAPTPRSPATLLNGALVTARLILRTLEESDRASYIDAARASREELDRFLPLHRAPQGDDAPEADDAMFDRQLDLARRGLRLAANEGVPGGPGQWLRLVAVLRDPLAQGPTVLGGLNLNGISRGLEWKADLNWWIRTDHAGKGYATEAAAALLDHALADLPGGLGLHAIHNWITRDNHASIRIADKLGFEPQGQESSYLLTDSTRWALHDLYIRR